MPKIISMLIVLVIMSSANTSVYAADPLLDIKANSLDEPITVAHTQNIQLSIELTPGSFYGTNSDWWIVGNTPFGWYHFNVGTSWSPGLSVAYQGPLFDLAPYQVLNSTLPEGTYYFYFGVDSVVNGSPDMDNIYYDTVSVIVSQDSYSLEEVNVNGIFEYRFKYQDHHFMTLVDDNGTLNLRPHPGTDINGWGSSWYLQPFLPGAMLSHASINSVNHSNTGISVDASGGVSYGVSSTYGTWSVRMEFSYNEAEKRILGAGDYTISLLGTLSSTTGDLNLFKIASNYLDNVPLLSGGIGDTGDMDRADVIGDGFTFTWIPPDQPSHFPSDMSDFLSIDVIGNYNEVDTAEQGYEPILAAYKPSLKVVLTSQNPGLHMIFGGVYDTSKSDLFYEDNVGITPLIKKESTETNYMFDIEFLSEALPGDN
ncbi:MAG: hypothetical protein K9N21_15560 [Deltaproteobacteria bacterium]|nr:hypothetical protein [Deltaproteobacteria bacterium]